MYIYMYIMAIKHVISFSAKNNSCIPIWMALRCSPLYPCILYLVTSLVEIIGKYVSLELEEIDWTMISEDL